MLELPILFIATSRPDRDSAGWRLVGMMRDLFGDAMTEIALRPLSTEESRELVANLLAIESLPIEVRDFILKRADGNPFFVEEVIRMLIDRGAIVREGDQLGGDQRASRASRSRRRCTASCWRGSTGCPKMPSGRCASPR